MRASASFSISETGVSRSATSRVQTTWLPARGEAGGEVLYRGEELHGSVEAGEVQSMRLWLMVTPSWSRRAAV